MNKFTLICVIVMFTGLLTGCRNDENTRQKPNIIFILTDDQRWDALGYAGNAIIQTPNMDNLADAGLYFENAFVTTAICAASRASLFTGLYERTHDYTFWKPEIRDEYMLQSFPCLLRKAGYQTGFVGKFGIKVMDGILDSMFDSHTITAYPYVKEINGQQQHLADINGNHAIDFIKKNKNNPFCLSLSFWSPHADDGSEQQYFWPEYVDSLYINDVIPVPETADPAFFEALPAFLKTTMNRERWYWRYDTPEKHQQMVKGYYRMISTVDIVIGRLRASLEEQGLDDNTIIILMGDNGYFLGERGYAGKWLLYEQSIRVPLIIFDPREPISKRSRKIDKMVLNVDVTPTILELAGLSVPASYQGKSLSSFYEEDPANWRSSIFIEHRLDELPEQLLRTEGIRDSIWKFIRYDDHPEYVELYNHRNDPYETKNLAYDGAYAELVERYQYMLDSAARKLISERKK